MLVSIRFARKIACEDVADGLCSYSVQSFEKGLGTNETGLFPVQRHIRGNPGGCVVYRSLFHVLTGATMSLVMPAPVLIPMHTVVMPDPAAGRSP
jgi:hypothetical protein